MKAKMKQKTISHKFVNLMPSEMEEGIVYVSIPYKTATHKCACGCGEIVVTPIRPTDWRLLWDGDTVTILPSIGSWSLPCRSHYFIIRNKIIWARRWSESKIKAGRAKDKIAKTRYYNNLQDLQKNKYSRNLTQF